MTIKISVLAEKGGVGKTTLSLNLAYGLAQKGCRVLLCDNDPQANSTAILLHPERAPECSAANEFVSRYEALRANVTEDEDLVEESFQILADVIAKAPTEKTISDVYEGRCKAADVIQPTRFANLDILPSSGRLRDTELNITQACNPYRLRNSLARIENQYDFIIFDNQPTFNSLTISTTTCCKDEDDLIIIPTKVDHGSLEAIESTRKYIQKLKEEHELEFQIRYLVNMRNRNKEDEAWSNALLSVLGPHTFTTSLRYQAAPVVRSSLRQQLLLEDKQLLHTKKGNVAHDMQNLVDEIYMQCV